MPGYLFFFFFFKQKTAYEMLRSLVGSEMCIRDRYQRRVRDGRSAEMAEEERMLDVHKCPDFDEAGRAVLASFQNPQQQPCLRRMGCPCPLCDTSYAELASCRTCLLYTSDAADEEDSVDLGGRRIIKKKKETMRTSHEHAEVALRSNNITRHQAIK
eukprot:TRINITY_DN25001_c0_g1_i1.p1 TRINITY_DN25001_c0_g1~~TRINITY_DN25001_c0_g1_i1.p1  ORF type:complete len:157 (+),score=47.06 TRINITY_DN25001_c0_g1_i1:116-586(+)